jgi:hypothetical protein
MRSLSPPLALPLLALLAAACAPTNKATPYPSTAPAAGDPAAPASSGLVRYFDRSRRPPALPLRLPVRALDAQPRDRAPVLLRHRRPLHPQDARPARRRRPLDLGKAVTVSDVDWSKRSLWSLHHHAASDTLWLHADERNDEQMNLWTLDLKSGALAQVTQHDYVYGLGFSADDTQVAYLPRSGTKAPFRSCLRVLDVKTRAAREVVCDTQALRFTWSEIRWSPDNDEVFFQAQVDGDRNRVQLVAVDLKAAKPTVKVLTDPKVPRTDANALEGWVDGDGLVFIANDDGYLNLHRLLAQDPAAAPADALHRGRELGAPGRRRRVRGPPHADGLDARAGRPATAARCSASSPARQGRRDRRPRRAGVVDAGGARPRVRGQPRDGRAERRQGRRASATSR